MKNFLPLLLGLLWASFSSAQITVTKHDLSNFHSKPSSRSIAQGADGTMYAVLVDYFYSGDGKVMVKNDGSGWVAMTPPCEDCILTVASSPSGEIWAGTTEGLYRLDDTNWILEWQGASVSLLHFTRSGKFYFIDNMGLGSWDGTSATSYTGSGTPVTTFVNQMVSDSQDRLMLRHTNTPFIFDGNEFQISNDFFIPNSIGVDENDVFWATSFGELTYFENEEWKTGQNFPSAVASGGRLLIDSDFNFWVGNGILGSDGAIHRYNRSLDNLQSIAYADLDENIDEMWYAAEFFEDRDGDIWVIGSESGVFYELTASDMTSGLTNRTQTLNKLKINPNPISDEQIALQLNLNESSQLNISLYNATGQITHRFASRDWPAGDHRVTLEVPELNSGVYLLQITTAQGEQLVRRFVK